MSEQEYPLLDITLNHPWLLLAGCLFLVLLGIVFVGMGATVLTVVLGKPLEKTPSNSFRDNLQRIYAYRKQVLAIFDGLVSNEQLQPRLQ